MRKADALHHWQGLASHLPILPHFVPINSKMRGSRYGACGIRIDGSPAFIDAVLSRLQDLIDAENHVTRLELSRNKVDGSRIGKTTPHAVADAECCYIRLHLRGREGTAASWAFDKHLRGATERYEQALED